MKDWFIRTIIGVLLAILGWVGHSFSARIDTIEGEHKTILMSTARMEQAVLDMKAVVVRIERKIKP